MKKSFNDILKAVQKRNLQETYDDLDPEIKEKNFGIALDLFWDLIARKSAVAPSTVNIAEIAEFVSNLYAGVNPEDLIQSYSYKETSGYNFNLTTKDVEAVSEQVINQLEFIIEITNELLESSKNNKTILSANKHNISGIYEIIKYISSKLDESNKQNMFYRSKYLRTQLSERKNLVTNTESKVINETKTDIRFLEEKLDPKDPIEVWIKDFIDSDDPKFEGKSKEKRKDMAMAAWFAARKGAGLKTESTKKLKESVTDADFDKIMVSIMNSSISEKFLDAVEAKDENLIHTILKSKIKDQSMIDEIIKRVLKD